MTSGTDRRAAVAAVAQRTTRRLYERFPPLMERFGGEGRARCQDDVRLHAAYLLAAVRNGASAYFRDYVRWSRQLMEGHGMHTEMLASTLEVLGEEVRSEPRLAPDDATALAFDATLAQHLCGGVRAVEMPGVPHGLTSSVGVATRRSGDDLHALLRCADRALYRAKRAGGDRVDAVEGEDETEADT